VTIMPPNCGTQCWLCDLPIHMDTYVGCSHGCTYCFTGGFAGKTYTGIKDLGIKPKNETNALRAFIKGKRTKETNWCDWPIPLHWGGMSDPFQPCEAIYKQSLECLKVFAETNYPFVVSTKGALIATEPYISLLAKCNCVVQLSMACEGYDKIEPGAPPFEERLRILKKVSKVVPRTVCRIQPYLAGHREAIKANLARMKEAGAYGVIIEGMKWDRPGKGLVKVGRDYTYPYRVISNDFEYLRNEAHQVGLKIYAGENRIREKGDSLTCCGIDGLDGFRPNTYNLNHHLHGDLTKPTEAMTLPKTAGCFRPNWQDTLNGRYIDAQSFAFAMNKFRKDKRKLVESSFALSEEGKR